jgi:hypothetical protein
MAQIERIRREGDFVLNELTLIVPSEGKEYDISGHWVQFIYEEDLFRAFTHFSVIMMDSIDYPSLIPLVGGERIRVSFTRQKEDEPINQSIDKGDTSRPSQEVELLDPITFEGVLYTIDNRHIANGSDKAQSYILQCISPEAVNAVKTKVTRAWKKSLYSDVVKDVFDEFIKENKELEVEPTLMSQDFVGANKKPVVVIKEIRKRAQSSVGQNNTLYTFYEDADSFHFKTINTLIEQPPVKTIQFEVNNVVYTNSISHADKDIARDINRVETYFHSKEFDLLDEMMNGQYSSSLLVVDPIRRVFETKEYSLEDNYNKFKHLESNKSYRADHPAIGNPKSRYSYVVAPYGREQQAHLVERDAEISSFFLEEVIPYRESQLEQIRKRVVTLNFPGDPRVRVGNIINFEIPEVSGRVSDDYPQEKDRYLNGKYLIVGISHVIEQTEYYISVDLIKDSYLSEIIHRDPIQRYKEAY